MQKVFDFFNGLPENTGLSEDNFLDLVLEYAEDRDVNVFYGASKGVFVFPDLDYVIKVPFQYHFNFEEEEDTELTAGYAREEDRAENTGKKFDATWDYCALEEEYGKYAIEAGLDHIFLPTVYIGCVNGYRLYKQAKMQGTFSGYSDRYNEKRKIFKKTTNSIEKELHTELSTPFLYKLIKTYTEEVCRQVIYFIDANNIRDLHSGNVGFRYGKPVIIDYSGFED